MWGDRPGACRPKELSCLVLGAKEGKKSIMTPEMALRQRDVRPLYDHDQALVGGQERELVRERERSHELSHEM
jgi:hypothetical protein